MNDAILLWTQIGAIGQVIGALATAAAVAVSLWVVLSERNVHIKVNAGLRLLIAGDGSDATDVIAILITNWGLRPVHVSSIGWRTGQFGFGPAWLKSQFAVQTTNREAGSQDPPFDLTPGQQKTIYIPTKAFFAGQNDDMRLDFFNRKPPWRHEPHPAKIYAMVFLVAAKHVVVRVEAGLEKFLATGRIEGGAASFNEKSRQKRQSG